MAVYGGVVRCGMLAAGAPIEFYAKRIHREAIGSSDLPL